MVRYPYLLFDADNTLLDFDRNGWQAFSMLCQKYKFPCNEKTYTAYENFNQPLWKQLEEGKITKDFLVLERFRLFLAYLRRDEDPAAVNQDFLAFMGMGTFLTPHAEEVCRSLSCSHQLYILTNSVETVHKSRMEHSALKPYIRASFISETIGCEKPGKPYFDYVMNHIPGITRDNCLLIGDSLSSDIQGGVNAGIPVCWYNPHHQSPAHSLPINYTISDLRELSALV